MSGLAQILSEIERRGIVVRVEGENLRLSPRRALDNELLKSISDHKKEIMGHTQGCWPLESLEAERRFHCQPHAKLFPFIGRKVRTPQGPGTLIQVVLLQRLHPCRQARKNASSASHSENRSMPYMRPHFGQRCLQDALREASQTGRQTM